MTRSTFAAALLALLWCGCPADDPDPPIGDAPVADVTPDPGPPSPEGPPTMAERGFVTVRSIIHLHSA